MNGTEKGSKQNVGERTVVQPTLRKLREGWGTRCVGNGKGLSTEWVGHPPNGDKLESTRQEMVSLHLP